MSGSARCVCRSSPATIGALFQLFGAPCLLAVIDSQLSGDSAVTIRHSIDELLRCGLLLLTQTAAAGKSPWESVDVLFHRFSRRGGLSSRLGVRADYDGAQNAPPVLRQEGSARVDLPVGGPSLELRLDEALESRRTRYGTDAPPITMLGALLRWVFASCEIDGAMHRRYPSGGNLHSLRPFVCTIGLTGLSAGIWEYDPNAHALIMCRFHSPELDLLLDEAAIGTGNASRRPAVLLVLASDFARVSRKYTGIAYSLVQKEVGAAFMALSLVGSALGLACVPIGTGNSPLFAAASALDEWTTPSVGEMLISIPPLDGRG